jgi:sodium/potassium-transporting ATPase subunit alpha
MQSIIERKVVGDASETGLIKFVAPTLGTKDKLGDLDAYRERYPLHQYKAGAEDIKCEIPFNSEIKFNLVIRKVDKKLTIFMKGAPDRIIERCDKIIIDGELKNMKNYEQALKDENEFYASLGERVLGFAKLELDDEMYYKDYPFDCKNWKNWYKEKIMSGKHEGEFPMWNLTFVGLVSLNDPPRLRVDYSVQKCRSAGIKVIMVTGDQPTTAAAIAEKVSIIKSQERSYDNLRKDKSNDHMTEEEILNICDCVVVHGDTLAGKHLSEENMDDRDPDKGMYLVNWINVPEVVFARTTPSQKLLIVDACQKAGHVVAVTGDGVNDSPAIKKADIGIAMGSGSDVAKNAADMLLLDDNFSSIVNGVEEGRLIFDNLKKSIAYTLSSNIPEIAPFLLFIVLQVPLPLSTVLILCIDLGTDMVPAISFAYENPELDIMERMPRNSKRDHLVNAKLISFAYLQIGMIQASAGFYTYF